MAEQHELSPLPEPMFSQLANPSTGEVALSRTGTAYWGSNWMLVQHVYTADQMHAHYRRGHEAGLAATPAPAPQWQPIETAPKDGSLFMCWVEAVQYGENDEGKQYQIDVSQSDFCQWQAFEEAPDGGWFEPCCGQLSDHQRVTHWMPLPAAPEAGQGKEAACTTR